MANERPASGNIDGPLRVYLVLARGADPPVTIVTAADPVDALRAWRRTTAACWSSEPSVVIRRGSSTGLIAEIDPRDLPNGLDRPRDWLIALAKSTGVIALFDDDAA